MAVTAAVLIAGMVPAEAAFEEAKLIAEDPQGSALFGLSVDLDGSTAIVGEPLDLSGSAYVFVRSDHAWLQQAKLVHTGISGGDNFGDAVAIEGDTAVVGAPRWDLDPDADHARGAAYVFTRSGSTWTQQAQLLSSDLSEFDRFGASVALDGDTMVIGAPGESGQFLAEGAAYVFTRSGTAWVEQAKLKAAFPQDTDVFGVSVAVDGDTVVVGSLRDTVDVGGQGSAYVFTRTGSSWTQQAVLVASDPSVSALFGVSVAVDGGTAVVGALRGNHPGAAYVFTRDGSVWTEQARLAAPGAVDADGFGVAVDLELDRVVAGAWMADVGDNRRSGRGIRVRSIRHVVEPGRDAGRDGRHVRSSVWRRPLREGARCGRRSGRGDRGR